jgi:S-DNA-T family DNA segregation ATPase FtsK/SpoIIIE
MKHDLLQVAVYARILSLARPGLQFHGTLEYYEPQLHEVNISVQELNSLFDEQVMPVLHEIAAGRPAVKIGAEKPADREAAIENKPAASGPRADFSAAIQKCFAAFRLDVAVTGQHEAPPQFRNALPPSDSMWR